MLKFKIEQVAICPKFPVKAMELLKEIGLDTWHQDVVTASGYINGVPEANSKAELAFNYEAISGNEFEVLHYINGENWMHGLEGRVSHLGMHCTEGELAEWREFFRERGIVVAQELFTKEHTNPVIAGKRQYHYVIFDTRDLIGVDLKFIVRRDV